MNGFDNLIAPRKAAEDSRTPGRWRAIAHSFSKRVEIYGPTEPRASVLECGCPLPLSLATMSLFLGPHPATFFRCCFESAKERFAKFFCMQLIKRILHAVLAVTVKWGDFCGKRAGVFVRLRLHSNGQEEGRRGGKGRFEID